MRTFFSGKGVKFHSNVKLMQGNLSSINYQLISPVDKRENFEILKHFQNKPSKHLIMSLKSVLPNPVHHSFDRDDEISTVKGK